MMLFHSMVIPLLQAGADTATTHIVVERGWLANVASVGQALVSILVAVMMIMIVLMLIALKRSLDELTKLVKGATEPVREVIGEARAVTSEVRRLTESVQAPVTRIVETMDEASDRARGVMLRAEDRLERLDALVGIVQDEAEGFVVKSASLARGMRVGGAALRAAFFARGNGKTKKARVRRPSSRPTEEQALEEGTSPPQLPEGGPRIRPRTRPAP